MVAGRPFQATQVTADGEFGKILKNLREVLNISERGMASAVELPLEVYREMENGTVIPDKEVLGKLAEKLHVEESTLSFFTDNTNSMRGPLRKLLEDINKA